MMVSAWDHIAFGAAEPARKMKALGIVSDCFQDRSIGVFNGGISFASCDGCVRYFLPANSADSHVPSRDQRVCVQTTYSKGICFDAVRLDADMICRYVRILEKLDQQMEQPQSFYPQS